MLLQLIQQIANGEPINPTALVGLLIALVFGITVHEFSHAFAATRLGDPLPGRQGRLSLQPAAHLEVTGSLMFLIAGFGWGKPVQYNPYALRTNPRTGGALIAVAGPLSNLILASVIALIARFLPLIFGISMRGLLNGSGPESILFNLLVYISYYNLVLCFFNLIPIPPLDGFSILEGVLPYELAEKLEPLRQYGFLFLLLLFIGGGQILGPIIYQPIFTILNLILGTRF